MVKVAERRTVAEAPAARLMRLELIVPAPDTCELAEKPRVIVGSGCGAAAPTVNACAPDVPTTWPEVAVTVTLKAVPLVAGGIVRATAKVVSAPAASVI